MKNDSDTVRSVIDAMPDHLGKKIQELYETNLPNINAKDILKAAIQSAIDNPAMTPDIKEVGEMFVILLEETGYSFKYDFDSVIEPIKEIVEKDTKSQSGSHAANVKHKENNRRREEIRNIWAKGNFSSRGDCAEQEWSAVGFGSIDTARKALKNTPDPFPWPAKKKS
jgi:hypothetical protein